MASEKDRGFDLSELNFELVKLYSSEYPGIIIKNITIEPATNISLASPKLLRIDLTRNSLKQSSGIFSAIYLDSKVEKRLYFRYRMMADVEVAKASRDISRDKKIDKEDVEFVLIPFERMFRKSISKDEMQDVSATRFIKAASIIAQSDFVKTPVVLRNSSVIASVDDSDLELEFEAVAVEDGSVGQMVTIKNKNGKTFRAVVVGPSRVNVK